MGTVVEAVAAIASTIGWLTVEELMGLPSTCDGAGNPDSDMINSAVQRKRNRSDRKPDFPCSVGCRHVSTCIIIFSCLESVETVEEAL